LAKIAENFDYIIDPRLQLFNFDPLAAFLSTIEAEWIQLGFGIKSFITIWIFSGFVVYNGMKKDTKQELPDYP
jgi:hypothetical protein